MTLLAGARIGNGAVIGAGAVVAGKIPPYSIAVGNPARVIKYRFDSDMIRKFQAIRWWDWSHEKIYENLALMKSPEEFVDKHYSPDLEKYPRDKIGNDLRDLKSKGFKIFSTALDFDSLEPLWKKIVQDFSECELKNIAMVLHAPQHLSNREIQSKLDGNFQSTPDKWIFATRFSVDAMRETDVLVTTRDPSSIFALDVLYSKPIETRYALDDLVFF